MKLVLKMWWVLTNPRTFVECLNPRAIVVSLAMLAILSGSISKADRLLDTGIYAGSFPAGSFNDGSPLFAYFLDKPDRAEQLRNILSRSELASKLAQISRVVDLVVVTVHPLAIIDGHINRNLASVADSAQVARIDSGLAMVGAQKSCAKSVQLLVSDDARFVGLFIYVFEPSGIGEISQLSLEDCLVGAFNLESQK